MVALACCPVGFGFKQRPMVRSGKIGMPTDDSHYHLTWNFWKSTQAFRKGLMDTSSMPSTKDLAYIEDTSETALPMTTSLTHATTAGGPAEKVAQIGLDASHKILQGFLRGLTPARASSMPVLVVDLWAHVGEMAKAVVMEKFTSSLGGPVYYVGFHDDAVEAPSVV